MSSAEFIQAVIDELNRTLFDTKIYFAEPQKPYSARAADGMATRVTFRFSSGATREEVQIHLNVWETAQAGSEPRCVVYGPERFGNYTTSNSPMSIAKTILDEVVDTFN